MYKNIGGKIKGLVKWVSLISIILIWIVAVLGALFSSKPVILLIYAAIVSVFVWIGSWVLYAFGQVVEDIHAIRKNEDAKMEQIKKAEREDWLNTEICYCPNCNSIVKSGEIKCKKCGQEFEW